MDDVNDFLTALVVHASKRLWNRHSGDAGGGSSCLSLPPSTEMIIRVKESYRGRTTVDNLSTQSWYRARPPAPHRRSAVVPPLLSACQTSVIRCLQTSKAAKLN